MQTSARFFRPRGSSPRSARTRRRVRVGSMAMKTLSRTATRCSARAYLPTSRPSSEYSKGWTQFGWLEDRFQKF